MSVFFFGGQWRARASDIIGTPVRAYIVLVEGGPSLAFSDEPNMPRAAERHREMKM